MRPEYQLNIIKCGENPGIYGPEEVGGKGGHLIDLYKAAQKIGTFNVPEFFIIPVNYPHTTHHDINTGDTYFNFQTDEVEKIFNELRKPVAVRSSSPLEDRTTASFAGMFSSFLDVNTFEDVKKALARIKEGSLDDRVKNYAEKMGVEFDNSMAYIVQEQVTEPWLKGIIQLEEEKAVIEAVTRKGKSDCVDVEYEFLEQHAPWNLPLKPVDYAAESVYFNMVESAIKAKKELYLEGLVQVEFCFSPGKLPDFVQIRQLPEIKSYADEIDITVPEGVPYIESDVCNDIAGELVLPAYVTTSQSGLKRILIETGQADLFMMGRNGDERAEAFYKKSKLASNRDFQEFKNLVPLERFEGLKTVLPSYNKAWHRGNTLFEDYILVCDKLDETISEMADATSKKRAIITCLESNKTSHAMTIARDLGIMCMGINEDLYEMDGFFHQVETGDTLHMKSNGKKAIAYLQKKRDSDPYEKME